MLFRAGIKFAKMSRNHKMLFVEAFIHLLITAFLVKFIPFHRWSATLGDITPTSGGKVPDIAAQRTADQIGYAIERLDHALGKPFTCLMKSCAGKRMLNRRKISSVLYIGVMHEIKGNGEQEFKAHAWLSCENRILVGATPFQYTVLSRFYD